MVTLKDIAKECKLSVTQVSRALNNHSDVNIKTKKFVLDTAKQMGYVKNILAQNLVNGDSKQIAFFVCGMHMDSNDGGSSNIYELIKGVQSYADESDYDVVIYLISDKNRSYVEFCKQRYISGVVIFGVDYDNVNFIELIESDISCVVIDIPVEGENKGSVLTNDNYYSQLAVDVLLDKGRRKIVLIGGHKHAYVTLQRQSGYQIAHSMKNAAIDPNLIVDADFDKPIAYLKTTELLAKYDDIDGFFCMSDNMAVGVMEAIMQAGKRIPEDISVIGYDGIALGESISPKLSTVKQNPFLKGYMAAKLLMEIIAGEATDCVKYIPASLEIRESS